METKPSAYPCAERSYLPLQCRDRSGADLLATPTTRANLILQLDEWRKTSRSPHEFEKLHDYLMRDIGLTRTEPYCGILKPFSRE